MIDGLSAVLVVALLWSFVDWVKSVLNRDLNGVLTQLVVWGAGVAVVFIASATLWAKQATINGVALDHLGSGSKIVAGILLGSLASAAYMVKRALDNSDSAKTLPLLGFLSSPPAVARPAPATKRRKARPAARTPTRRPKRTR